MNKKHTFKKTAALLLGLALTVGATGCNFVVTDSQADLKQIVAHVDVTNTLAADKDLKDFAKELDKIIAKGGMTTDIPKRDLVAYFLSVGASYVQNYGYSYKDTVNMLMDGLVNRKIMAQYAVAYYLKKGTLTADGCVAYVENGIKNATGKEKTLLSNHRDVLSMKYFLTENDTVQTEYNEAVYNLMKSLNSSLDSAEQTYIKAEEQHEHTHDETRTTPTNANVEKTESNYVPMTEDGKAVDYDIYTGRYAVSSCGAYEELDGSTATTRKKAYSAFLSNLQSYGLIKENEDTTNVKELDYYYLELSSSLEQALINKFYEDMKKDALDALTKDYVEAKYTEIKDAQQYAYEKDPTSFSTKLDSMSNDSFVLYGEQNYGFIYNILLPFSASQEREYAAAKNKGGTQEDNFKARREILNKITAKDLRSAWFCEEDSDENYSYKADSNDNYYNNGLAKGNDTYLFFENQTGSEKNTEKYESLGQYAGLYPYNGEAKYTDGEWEFKPNMLTIDGFMQEMEGYINKVVGSSVIDTTETAFENRKKSQYNTDSFLKDGKVDYSNFIYYEGKVNLTNTSRDEYFYAGTETEKNDAYLATSAVNELMFAYSTDPGCLNKYMGYTVSPHKTDFVPEFEYAAQYAVSKGVGTYVVAPSDYGWHVIYVTFVFGEGDVYEGFVWDDVEKEGTFSNLFYESLKSTTATNYTTEVENSVLNVYKGSATRFVKAYQDLIDLDKQ